MEKSLKSCSLASQALFDRKMGSDEGVECLE